MKPEPIFRNLRQYPLDAQFKLAQSPFDGYLRIETPFFFKDGNLLDIWVSQLQGVGNKSYFKVSDLGETVDWLWCQSGNFELTTFEKQIIKEDIARYGVVFDGYQFQAPCPMSEPIRDVVFQVAQASLGLAACVSWELQLTRLQTRANKEI